MKIKTTNGVFEFDPNKMKASFTNAFSAADLVVNDSVLDDLVNKVRMDLMTHVDLSGVVDKEKMLDVMEEALMARRYFKAAQKFIRYRFQHLLQKDLTLTKKGLEGTFKKYIDQSTWSVKENANMGFSLQGLNNAIVNGATERFWLDIIYPKEVSDAHKDGYLYIHDLGLLSSYCCGWDLSDLLTRGFGGVPGKIFCSPPKHFAAAMGQAVNFLYTLQGEVAGAIAFSNFDTLLSPFIRSDGLTYKQVKEVMQMFIYNMNVPTRVGSQSPFSNITLDLTPPPHFKHQPVIIGGVPQSTTYGEYQKEMDIFNRAFFEVMSQGDATGRVFTFPIPTINVGPDFNWDNKNLDGLWEITAKYGVPYYSNFINSDMKPEDTRSLCCRLRLSTKELHKRGGGLFGANALTGSIGVCTLNLPLLAYEANGSVDVFFGLIEKYANVAKNSLEIKRKAVEDLSDKGLYPYSSYYLNKVKQRDGAYWSNHFSTIGMIGMYEAASMLDIKYDSPEGAELGERVMQLLNGILLKFQESTGHLYNLEATPAEGATYKLAKKAIEKYSKITTSGQGEKYFTNSMQLPVNYSADIFKVLEHQDKIQSLFSGGTVQHMYLGSPLTANQAKDIIRKVFQNYSLPYLSITPTFTICQDHGYIPGEHTTCPACVKEKDRLEKKIARLSEEVKS